jgi:hypothetical protein
LSLSPFAIDVVTVTVLTKWSDSASASSLFKHLGTVARGSTAAGIAKKMDSLHLTLACVVV